MTGITSPTEDKRAVLGVLKRRGPCEAQDIASELGVTAMAVRQHLYALEEEGLVSFAAAPKTGGRGRPSKLWCAESPADALFADAHAELSVELIGNIRSVFGERGLTKLIEKRTEQQIASYREALASAQTLREKVKRLARLRSEAGYMAEAVATDDGFLLIENHCPICRAATACSGLCDHGLPIMESKHHREPWNKGKSVGQKPPLKPKDIWAIRINLQIAHQVRQSDSETAARLRRCCSNHTSGVPRRRS